MKSDGLGKILGIGFALAIILYAASFKWIQHQREWKGPWTILFASDADGIPSITISQPTLTIEKCKLVFPDQRISQTNLSQSVTFSGPTTNVPFGQLVFQDPTFLPGTIAFNFWGHGVDLLPRTLIVDKTEIPWQSNTNLLIQGEGKFELRTKKKRSDRTAK